ncbi:uncharacterized protein METZ01_LOCUS378266 [marine metagenome]|uniref:Uncharacterized protein n=1 Tax=marine metagenome TaxID=408172 RepID=A0A382TUL3_9ZZZZ
MSPRSTALTYSPVKAEIASSNLIRVATPFGDGMDKHFTGQLL